MSPQAKEAFAPAQERSIADYAENFVTLPSSYTPSGPIRFNKNRYLLRVLEALLQAWVRQVTFLKAVQTGGSLVWDLFLAWLIRLFPGPTMFNMQTDDDAKDHAQFRINELLKICEATAPLLPTGHRDNICKKRFDLMWLLIQGANKSNLQNKSTCYVGNDELAFWRERGLTRDADARITQYNWRSKRYYVSQGGEEGDELDQKYYAGSREEWNFPCPVCAFVQPYKWMYDNDPEERGGMKWETNEITRPDGEWNFDKLAETIYYECRQCGHRIKDTPEERDLLDQTGRYVVGNPKSPRDEVSLHVNAMACVDIAWRELVKEWCEAMDALNMGDIEPFKRFIQKRLAESFKESQLYSEKPPKESRDYKLGDKWDRETVRILTIDKQMHCVYYVCREWTDDGDSRLVEAGKLDNEDEVKEVVDRLEVEETNVAEDSAFDPQTVHEFCCIYGWGALLGDDAKDFLWALPEGNERRPYSKEDLINPSVGFKAKDFKREKTQEFMKKRVHKFAAQVRWSNPYFKMFLNRLKQGKGKYWGIPDDIHQDYLDQLEGEKWLKIKGVWKWKKTGGKGDHYLDCERMNLVMATIYGVFQGDSLPTEDEKPEDEKEEEATAA